MLVHLTCNSLRLLLHMAMSMIFVAVTSCSQDRSEYSDSPQPIMVRHAYARVQAYQPDDGPSLTHVEGKAPCLVGAVASWLNDFQPGTTKVYNKVELDFGDGSGWQDVTADAPGWDHYPYDGLDQAHVTLHTYTVPGEYRVRTRVTYWDGEAVESSPSIGGEPVVTVTQ